MPLFRWLRDLFTPGPAPRSKAASRRLGLEALEGRDCPAGGALDPTFGSGGAVSLTNPGGFPITSNLTQTAVQADGKVLVLTTSSRTQYPAVGQASVTRMNADGSLDTAFGSGGTALLPVGASNFATDLDLQPDGKILVASQSWTPQPKKGPPTNQQYSVARLNTNGTLDQSFGGANTGWWIYNPSSRDEAALDLAVVPEGASFSIYVGGGAVLANNNQATTVAKLNAAGMMVTSFGSGGVATRDMAYQAGSTLNVTIGDLAVTSSGRAVLLSRVPGGLYNTQPSALVAFTSAGQTDTGFNGNGMVIVSVPGALGQSVAAIAAQGEDIVAVGVTTRRVDTIVAASALMIRYTSAGSLDPTFANGGIYIGPAVPGSHTTNFKDVAIAADGSIVVFGGSNLKDASGTSQYGLLLGHFSADGEPDANFGSAPDGSGLVAHYDQSLSGNPSLALDPVDGDIVISMILTSPSRLYVLRFTGPA